MYNSFLMEINDFRENVKRYFDITNQFSYSKNNIFLKLLNLFEVNEEGLSNQMYKLLNRLSDSKNNENLKSIGNYYTPHFRESLNANKINIEI